MEPAPHSQPVEVRSKKVRSKLSNGSRLLPMTDGRSATARRYRDLFEAFVADLGGADRLSEGQKQLCRRGAMLAAECERMEAQAMIGEDFNVEIYGAIVDRLGRLFQRIGLRRVARDATPTLREYLDGKKPIIEIEE